MIEVCAAFIKKDDKVLICKRPEGKTVLPYGNSPAEKSNREKLQNSALSANVWRSWV